MTWLTLLLLIPGQPLWRLARFIAERVVDVQETVEAVETFIFWNYIGGVSAVALFLGLIGVIAFRKR